MAQSNIHADGVPLSQTDDPTSETCVSELPIIQETNPSSRNPSSTDIKEQTFLCRSFPLKDERLHVPVVAVVVFAYTLISLLSF